MELWSFLMKKKLIAVVVSAAAVMPVLAAADVNIYGRVHVSTDFWTMVPTTPDQYFK